MRLKTPEKLGFVLETQLFELWLFCQEAGLIEAESETKSEQQQSQPCKVDLLNQRCHQKAQTLMTTLFWHEM